MIIYQRFKRSLHWFTLALSLKLLLLPASCFSGEAELSRVKNEWPKAALHLDKVFSQVRGTAKSWTETPNAQPQTNYSEIRFAIDNGMEKTEFTGVRKSAKIGTSVYCVGNNTAFHIKRPQNTNEYEIIGVGSSAADENAYWTVFGCIVHAAHSIMGRAMTEVFQESNFEIVSAEPLGNFIKVECKRDFNNFRSRSVIVVDPNSGWVLHSATLIPSDPSEPTLTLEIEYGEQTHNGIPLPSKVKFNQSDPRIKHFEFTDWTFEPTPISEFNLNHYGLPDLVHMRRQQNLLPYWLASAAVLVGLIAFGFWRLWSRTPGSTQV